MRARLLMLMTTALTLAPALAAAQGVTYGLERGQVRTLQRRLAAVGCNAGAADGLIGPRTLRALECARGVKGVPGGDINALLHALELPFTAPNPRNIADGARHPQDTSGIEQFRGAMANVQARVRARRDSVRRDSLRRDSLRADSLRRRPPR